MVPGSGPVRPHGGSGLGLLQTADVPSKGKLTFVYAIDPRGNIIELHACG
jgi:hypothetical protein